MRPIDYLNELSFVRRGGSKEERRAAEMIARWLSDIGYTPQLEEFDIYSFEPGWGTLTPLSPSGEEIKVRPVGLSADGDVEGEIFRMFFPKPEFVNPDDIRGKIVFMQHYPRWKWMKLFVESGVKACVIVLANHRENSTIALSQKTAKDFGDKIPLATMSFEKAISLVQNDVPRIRLKTSHKKFFARSQNVVCELPGDTDRMILFTAHYDSTPCSPGAQDNAAGTAELIEVMKNFAGKKFRRTMRFIFCGSEEMGLLGSKHYANSHIDELERVDFLINLDVGGDPFTPICVRTLGTDAVFNYIDGILKRNGIYGAVEQDIYSSDGMPFGKYGVPSLSIARSGIDGKGHSPFDEAKNVCDVSLKEVVETALIIAEDIANAKILPFERKISDEMKKKVKKYFDERR
ncbi:hypothetical protein DRQ26_05010 [bacterium]|nr:MAG: hypothetical protein DRQ26_05010 [bacterium]